MKSSKYTLLDKTMLMPEGLSLLMMNERPTYFTHLDQCVRYTRRMHHHPLGLAVTEGHEVQFVGAAATDITVEVFLANIRFWAGYCDGRRITKLRAISIPVPEQTPNQHHVFFEFWSSRKVIISGETTDCSGAGNEARTRLEAVFTVLSTVYGVEIERVTLPEAIDPCSLYED